MFLAHAVAMQMQSLNDLKAHYKLEEDVWGAFTDCAGDPGQDIRLLAVLPAAVLTASLQRAQLPDGTRLTAIQVAHVGLVYNLARRILHVRDGGPWESWTEENLFGDQGPQPNTTPQSSAGTPTLETKLKVSQVLEQGDDGEFCVETEDSRAGWLEKCR
jgi:hypothetical protein